MRVSRACVRQTGSTAVLVGVALTFVVLGVGPSAASEPRVVPSLRGEVSLADQASAYDLGALRDVRSGRYGERYPQIAPGGQHLSYLRLTAERYWNVLVRPLLRGRERSVGRLSDREDGPVWAPDGSRLAFLESLWNLEIVTIRPDGSGRRVLRIPRPAAHDSWALSLAGWTSEGIEFVLYVNTRPWDPRAPRMDMVVDPDGRDVRPRRPPLACPEETLCAASPDATRVAYVEGGALVVAQADGTSHRTIGAASRLPMSPWSPDGHRVAAVITEAGTRDQVVVYAADGSAAVSRTRVFSEGIADAYVRWSPQGDALAFIVTIGGQPRLAVSDLESGSVVLVSADRDRPRGATWTPDGARLTFTSGTSVVTVRRDGSGRVVLATRVHEQSALSAEGRTLAYDALVSRCPERVAVHLVSLDGSLRFRTSRCRLGSAHGDILIGTADSESLLGRGGNDVLRAGAGDDNLSGGTGDDVLVGGPGEDTIHGGPGHDRIDASDPAIDFVDCGSGRDTVVLSRREQSAGWTRGCERIVVR